MGEENRMPQDMKKDSHQRYLEKKWESLKARGETPPKDIEENRKRAKEAHGY